GDHGFADGLGQARVGVDQPADVTRQRLPVHGQVALVHELTGPGADHVEAQHRAAALRDDLPQAVGLAQDHGAAVAGHRVLVHLDVVAGLAGLGLGQAGPRHLGVGVDDPGALAVVDLHRLLTEDPVAGDDGLGVGDVGQPGRRDAVADRVHAGARRLHGGGVDLDEAPSVH